MPVVICKLWVESEREPGWTTQRPDGYSLHMTEDDLAAYTKAHWATYPDKVPDYYTGPAAQIGHYKVEVTPAVYQRLRRNKTNGGAGVKFDGTPPDKAPNT